MSSRIKQTCNLKVEQYLGEGLQASYHFIIRGLEHFLSFSDLDLARPVQSSSDNNKFER